MTNVQNSYYARKQYYKNIVESVTLSLSDKSTLHQIEQIMTLSLFDLVSPNLHFRHDKIPKPQNKYIIYRRNFQAKYLLYDKTTTNTNMHLISNIAAKSWKKEPKYIRDVYEFLALCAKKVHTCIFPNYLYKPKNNATTLKNSLFPIAMTLEINPNLMDPIDKSICKKFDKHLHAFL